MGVYWVNSLRNNRFCGSFLNSASTSLTRRWLSRARKTICILLIAKFACNRICVKYILLQMSQIFEKRVDIRRKFGIINKLFAMLL